MKERVNVLKAKKWRTDTISVSSSTRNTTSEYRFVSRGAALLTAKEQLFPGSKPRQKLTSSGLQ